MGWLVPLVIYSTAILGAVRWTRGLALAAMPLQLFLCVFAYHKLSAYLVHEVALFAGAVAIGALVLLNWAAQRLPAALQRRVLPAAAALLGIYLIAGSPMLKAARLSMEPRIHEAEVARAAAREILGPNARVGGDWGEWYVSGGTHFYNTQSDIRFGSLGFDPRTYASNLDALVDCPDYCVSGGGNSAGGWYADGTLRLRGFYFGETNDQLQFLLFSVARPAQLVGYASHNGQLYRFQQETGGSYDTISAVCPISPGTGLTQYAWYQEWPGVFWTVLDLPDTSPAQHVLVTLLAPKAIAEPAGWMGRNCREISRIPGTLLLADARAMVEQSRRTGPPMHFYRSLDQVPGYVGVGLPPSEVPPPGTVRVDNVIDVSQMEAANGARMDPGPERRLTTLPHMGGYYASIPVRHPETVGGPCWVQLRLRVLSGRVGFLVSDIHKQEPLARTLGIGAARDPQTIALRVPDFRAATQIFITNESSIGAQVEVLGAAILMPR
jgi:hypothetical protein